jgi:hypothetical protein
VRDHFTDPHVNPRLRRLDGYDDAVVAAVMSTAGIPELIDSIVAAASAFRGGPQPGRCGSRSGAPAAGTARW